MKQAALYCVWATCVLVACGADEARASTADSGTTSTTFAVGTSGELQRALDLAQPGDTILLEAGATFVGNFTLPAKPGGAFITLRSSAPDALLPADGVRMDPRFASLLPKLRSPNTSPALATAAGAQFYRLLFLEFQANVNGAGNIIALGDGSSRQSSLTGIPHTLVLDRLYIRGDATAGQKRGIALNSGATSIVNSYIADIKAVGQDSQAIGGWNGPGPYEIVNNYLEAAGENVLFGGADPSIAGLVPSDITFVRNHVSKPLTWRGSQWLVKNLFELKNAQRVVIEDNLFEYNWAAAQSGYAILLKSVNQDGRAPWSVVQHVRFNRNVVRHVSSAINILGRDLSGHPAIEANNLTFSDNLFYDVSGARYGASGRLLLINGGSQIAFDHNTAITEGSTTLYADGQPVFGFSLTNNILVDNGGGAIKGGGTGAGTATLAAFFPGSHVVGNIIVGALSASYPAGNFYPRTIDAVGFANHAAGDYAIAGTSAYALAATDGTAPGFRAAPPLASPGSIGSPVAVVPPVSTASGTAITGSVTTATTAATASPGGTISTSVASASPATATTASSGDAGGPRNFKATANGGSVAITWSPPAAGAVSRYVLEAGSAAGLANLTTVHLPGSQTSLDASAVAAGIYFLRVKSIDARGVTSRSAELQLDIGGASSGASACVAAPARPARPRATVQQQTVTLEWDPPAGCGATHYIVLAGSRPGAADIAQTMVPATSLRAVAPAGTYYVRLVAANAVGSSTESDELVLTVRP